jgi:hypothetical protein
MGDLHVVRLAQTLVALHEDIAQERRSGSANRLSNRSNAAWEMT